MVFQYRQSGTGKNTLKGELLRRIHLNIFIEEYGPNYIFSKSV